MRVGANLTIKSIKRSMVKMKGNKLITTTTRNLPPPKKFLRRLGTRLNLYGALIMVKRTTKTLASSQITLVLNL